MSCPTETSYYRAKSLGGLLLVSKTHVLAASYSSFNTRLERSWLNSGIRNYSLNILLFAYTLYSVDINMEYFDLDLVVVWLTKCVISAYLS